MFGPERSGLSNEDLDLCHAYIRIPTGEFASMNLAQAVNLVAYEFFVTHAERGESRQVLEPAPREALERLHRHFLEVARYIGYTNDETFHKTDPHVPPRLRPRAPDRTRGRGVARFVAADEVGRRPRGRASSRRTFFGRGAGAKALNFKGLR